MIIRRDFPLKRTLLTALVLSLGVATLHAFDQRPVIEANAGDKARALALIGKHDWAASVLNQMKKEVAAMVAAHQAAPAKALAAGPSIVTGGRVIGNWMADARKAAVIHFLTGDEACAQLVADRLNSLVQEYGVAGKEPLMGGWEPRGIFHEIALCYDFIHPFLTRPGTTVFDAASGKRIPFDDAKAQILFTNIVEECFKGSPGTSNIAVMYFDSHLYSALCIKDQAKRDGYVDRIVNGWGKKNGSGMVALKKSLMKNRGVLPESASYSGAGEAVPIFMEVLDRNYPGYRIFEGFEEALLGVAQRWFYNYPNGKEMMAFGDSRRLHHVRSSDKFNRVIRRAGFENVAKQVFGKIKADRATHGYQPEDLWTMDPLDGYQALPVATQSLHLLHAGLAMQNNLHCADPALHGLMCYTAGGTYVHSQLSGLDLELYGAGQVMSGVGAAGDAYGNDGPEDRYGATTSNRSTFRFINFYRNYAGHNTVVINGESVGAGTRRGRGEYCLTAWLVSVIFPLSAADGVVLFA